MSLTLAFHIVGFILQVLILPALAYVVSIDRRVSRIEGACLRCTEK